MLDRWMCSRSNSDQASSCVRKFEFALFAAAMISERTLSLKGTSFFFFGGYSFNFQHFFFIFFDFLSHASRFHWSSGKNHWLGTKERGLERKKC